MKKTILFISLLFFCSMAQAEFTTGDGFGGTVASGVGTSTTNFTGNLSSADNTVQKALDTLDNLAVGGAQDLDSVLTEGSTSATNNLTLTAGKMSAATVKVGTLTGVLRADTGEITVDSDVTDIVSAATTSTAGKVILATYDTVNTGTDTSKAITPDALAGSIHGTKNVQIMLVDPTTDTAVGEGKAYFLVSPDLNGMNLIDAEAQVITAGSSGTTVIDIDRCAYAATGNACSGTVNAMLSTKLYVDASENSSVSATADAVINTSNDDVATNQVLRINVDEVASTAAKGLIVNMRFQTP